MLQLEESMARVQIAINREKCKLPLNCRKCVQVCPQCVYKIHLTRIDKGKEMPPDAWELAMWFPDQCRGCLECVRVCPENALELVAPCEYECPAHVDVPSYISLLGEGKVDEAIHLHRERNPLVAVSARVCPHPCETMCERRKIDAPVSIRGLKRYMADIAILNNVKPVMKEDPRNSKKKIAVVGSGPAGLSCAYFLRRLGYPVTIFEMANQPGGMLTSMIPPHRLPQDIVNKEIDLILNLGIELKLNTKVGKDISIGELQKQGYEAIFLGIGAQKPLPLGIAGEDLNGVIDALDFLKAYRSGKNPKIGEKVAVIGGGNAAIDAARTAVRMGASVTVLYRRNREEMPAIQTEVEEAEKEGVEIKFLARPKEVKGKDGKVEGLVCEEMEIKGYDRSARQRSVPVPGKEFSLKVDTIIVAIGQKLDADEILNEAGIGLSYKGFIYVDKHTAATNIPYIFAAGDAVSGPSNVTEAIGQGEKAARSIDKYLAKDFLTDEDLKTRYPWLEHYQNSITFNTKAAPAKYSRTPTPLITIGERMAVNVNKEVELTFSREDVVRECARCLRCDYIAETEIKRIKTAGAR